MYHVTARAARGLLLFEDDIDFQTFLLQLGKTIQRMEWVCPSFCLIPNHFHLLIETPTANLAEGMHRLNGHYAQTYNQRHGGRGHVFQGRYSDTLIQSEGHLLEVHRYIPLNPVRAGLCRRPEDWPWSSYAALIGCGNTAPCFAPEAVLELFDGPGDPRHQFAAFVEQGLIEDFLAA